MLKIARLAGSLLLTVAFLLGTLGAKSPPACPTTLVLPGPGDRTAYAATLAALETVAQVTDQPIGVILPLESGVLRLPCRSADDLVSQLEQAMGTLDRAGDREAADPVSGLLQAFQHAPSRTLILVTTTPVSDMDQRVRDQVLPTLAREGFQVHIAGPDTGAARAITHTSKGTFLTNPAQDPLAVLRVLALGMSLPFAQTESPSSMSHQVVVQQPGLVTFTVPRGIRAQVFDPDGQLVGGDTGGVGGTGLIRFPAQQPGEYLVLLAEPRDLAPHFLYASGEPRSMPWTWIGLGLGLGVLAMVLVGGGYIYQHYRRPQVQLGRTSIVAGRALPATETSRARLQVLPPDGGAAWERMITPPLTVGGDPVLTEPQLTQGELLLPLHLDPHAIELNWYDRNGRRNYTVSTYGTTAAVQRPGQTATLQPGRTESFGGPELELSILRTRLKLAPIESNLRGESL